MANITMGVYDTHNDAEFAINELVASGVKNSDISYIYTDKDGDVKEGQSNKKMTSGAIGGGTAGAVIGGVAGLVVANGILPGIGSFFVAGPLAAALGLSGAAATTVAGAATGAAAGGIIGALTQLGVNNEDAELYEALVLKGDVLIIARTDDSNATRVVFERTNAMEVREYVV
ncbi:MAG: hypothetical protein ACK42D_03065 [Candidatus Paceibacteria bacterium]